MGYSDAEIEKRRRPKVKTSIAVSVPGKRNLSPAALKQRKDAALASARKRKGKGKKKGRKIKPGAMEDSIASGSGSPKSLRGRASIGGTYVGERKIGRGNKRGEQIVAGAKRKRELNEAAIKVRERNEKRERIQFGWR